MDLSLYGNLWEGSEPYLSLGIIWEGSEPYLSFARIHAIRFP